MHECYQNWQAYQKHAEDTEKVLILMGNTRDRIRAIVPRKFYGGVFHEEMAKLGHTEGFFENCDCWRK